MHLSSVSVICPHGMPNGNIARRVQKLGQGIVPCLPIGPVDLNVDDVLMVSPGLMQQEPVLVFAIPVQGCVHEGLFVPHGVEQRIQQFQKTFALGWTDLKADKIGGVHGSYSLAPCISALRVAASAG